jgi:hypothetical protein
MYIMNPQVPRTYKVAGYEVWQVTRWGTGVLGSTSWSGAKPSIAWEIKHNQKGVHFISILVSRRVLVVTPSTKGAGIR